MDQPKLYIPSTLNIDIILWHNQLCVQENVKSWFKSWIISFTFEAYVYPAPGHTLNCICASLFYYFVFEF